MVDGTTEVSANKKAHRRGASVKITNFQLVTLTNIINNTDQLPGVLQYEDSVSTTTISADAQNLASKAYVDYISFSGASVIDATESAKGVVELATQIEMASSTASGSSGPLVLQAQYATSTPGSTGHYVPITDATGILAEGFLPTTLTQDYTHSGSFTQTGTTTFSGVVIGPAQAGDGSDGDVTISGSTSLTRDMFMPIVTGKDPE